MPSSSHDWETTLAQTYVDYHTLNAFHNTLRDEWQAFADTLQASFPDLLSVSPRLAHLHSCHPEIFWQGTWRPTNQTITLVYRNDSFSRLTLRFLADTVLWEHTWDPYDHSPLDCSAIAAAWHLWVMTHATYPATSDDFVPFPRWIVPGLVPIAPLFIAGMLVGLFALFGHT